MKITGIIWLEEIFKKLAPKHRVEQQEVREVLARSLHRQMAARRGVLLELLN